MASFEPIGRGAEPRVATTVATATCASPRARQRLRSGAISFISETRLPLRACGLGLRLHLRLLRADQQAADRGPGDGEQGADEKRRVVAPGERLQPRVA